MGTVHKLKRGKYTAGECISDMASNIDATESLVAVVIDKEGDIHIRGSNMKNSELCMCSMMLTIYVQKFMAGETE